MDNNLRYLQLLSRSFPNIATASTEIINLEAILYLPKGTEHFLADLHGEYDAFQHVVRNASGAIKRKVREIYGDTLSAREQQHLCTLIYYPSQKLELEKMRTDDISDWYFITINRLVRVCRNVASKYSRSKVHKALPTDFAYIIQELLQESQGDADKQAYVDVIVQTIISTRRADDFIIALCNLIQQLAVDQLHILGDVFDRGPHPDKIMDLLSAHHNFDIQWGNHDILWMGAAAGNHCCLANVLRITLRYANQSVIEDGYGINLLPLATFAMKTYQGDPCTQFTPHPFSENALTESEMLMLAQMHKAITVIQFKLEGSMIARHPEYQMDDRRMLHLINKERGTITINGQEYSLIDSNFPTIDPLNPYELSEEEHELMHKISRSFKHSEKMRRHMKCLFQNGNTYKVTNGNLLYHASIPLNADGSLKSVLVVDEYFKGKQLMDKIGETIRTAYYGDDNKERHANCLDYIWYLWCGPDSPLFDKDKMATLESYFIADHELAKEKKGYYYQLRDQESVCDMILDEFQVSGTHRHIINGHVPVRTIRGEQPIKAGGKMMVIDGGFSKAYQPKTGIAGYTLVYHSRGFQLVQHEPFSTIQQAVTEGQDIKSTTQLVEMSEHRMRVKDTDVGRELLMQISDLKALLKAYRQGAIGERSLKPLTNKR